VPEIAQARQQPERGHRDAGAQGDGLYLLRLEACRQFGQFIQPGRCHAEQLAPGVGELKAGITALK
jgi:hypothetical protein